MEKLYQKPIHEAYFDGFIELFVGEVAHEELSCGSQLVTIR
jgi:hypothetical protein